MAWFAETCSPPRTSPSSDNLRHAGDHFDFVEVGTSNYQTVVQACVGHPDGKHHALSFMPWDREPGELRGLVIDMQRPYLDELPDLPNVQKICAAVAERDGEVRVMWHVPVQFLEHYEKVFATAGNNSAWHTLQLAKAISSLGAVSASRLLRTKMRRLGLSRLVRRRRVRTRSLASIFSESNVGSVSFLALDCEGHDCAIIHGLLKACRGRPSWYPEWIQYETHGMNDELSGAGTQERTEEELQQAGYHIMYAGWDTVAWRDRRLDSP